MFANGPELGDEAFFNFFFPPPRIVLYEESYKNLSVIKDYG
jgi:hypothetical protein